MLTKLINHSFEGMNIGDQGRLLLWKSMLKGFGTALVDVEWNRS